jgi:hypothetical protein
MISTPNIYTMISISTYPQWISLCRYQNKPSGFESPSIYIEHRYHSWYVGCGYHSGYVGCEYVRFGYHSASIYNQMKSLQLNDLLIVM